MIPLIVMLSSSSYVPGKTLIVVAESNVPIASLIVAKAFVPIIQWNPNASTTVSFSSPAHSELTTILNAMFNTSLSLASYSAFVA